MAVMPGQDAFEGSTPRAALPPVAVTALSEEAHLLGAALLERVAEVVARTGARIRELGYGGDPDTQSAFERINRISTTGIARWLSGEGSEAAREAGRQSSQLYSELFAHRSATLQEIGERWLAWRDATAAVLRASAAELCVPDRALAEALSVLQGALEVSFVRLCRAVDHERQDADAQLAQSKDELAYVATHDALTGLPNRALILDRTEQMLARAGRNGTPVAALSIDIDNFRAVNESLGRAAGDQLLRALAARLDDTLRGSDTLGRLGGNEFVAVCEGALLEAGPELIAERLLESLRPPFALDADGQKSVSVSVSIGIAAGVRPSAEELLRDANAALYAAKRNGRNRFVLYERKLQDAIQSRAALELALRDAQKRDELFLVYQPIFDLTRSHVTAVEALIRWRHSERGVVPPNDFIPLAEESGLIVEIGAWVLREACAQGAAWARAGYAGRIAVNVSARQLDSDRLLGDVEAALAESGLDAQRLVLEVTETALMRNVDDTVELLRRIKGLGARIAIDDFGTGYSSLAHLQRFPVDALKIDRAFVSRLGAGREALTFMRTLIGLGKSLSIETVAEGIEHKEELFTLRSEGCDLGQGFLFARPLELADAEAMLLGAPRAPALDASGLGEMQATPKKAA